MNSLIPKKLIEIVYKKVPETKYAIAAMLSTALMLLTGSLGAMLQIATNPLSAVIPLFFILGAAAIFKFKRSNLKLVITSGLVAILSIYSLGLWYMYFIPESYKIHIYVLWTALNGASLYYLIRRISKNKTQLINTVQNAYLEEMIKEQGVSASLGKDIRASMNRTIQLQKTMAANFKEIPKSPEEVEKILQTMQRQSNSHRRQKTTKHRK